MESKFKNIYSVLRCDLASKYFNNSVECRDKIEEEIKDIDRLDDIRKLVLLNSCIVFIDELERYNTYEVDVDKDESVVYRELYRWYKLKEKIIKGLCEVDEDGK